MILQLSRYTAVLLLGVYVRAELQQWIGYAVNQVNLKVIVFGNITFYVVNK